MNSQRITRLIRLIEVLKKGGGHNATGLAKTCNVSRRTIFRDIEVLRFAGLPVGYDEELDCYKMMCGDDLQPIRVTPSEAFALVAIVLQTGLRDRLPIYESAASATHKLWSGVSATAKRRLHRLRRAIVVRPSQTNTLSGKAKLFQQLVEARVSGRVVRIAYDTGQDNSIIKTTLRPYQLVSCQHNWYVVGRSSYHGEVRTFSLSRVSHPKLLSKRYRVPRDFNLDRYVGNAWALHPGTGEDYAVAVRFSRAVATSVTDTYWHRTQQIESEKSGAIIFRAQVSGLNEIASWILSFGDQAEVIEPAPLRQLVSQHVRKLASLYEQQSDSADGVRGLKQPDKSCKAELAMQVQAL
jgi:proteasome accessory factor B